MCRSCTCAFFNRVLLLAPAFPCPAGGLCVDPEPAHAPRRGEAQAGAHHFRLCTGTRRCTLLSLFPIRSLLRSEHWGSTGRGGACLPDFVPPTSFSFFLILLSRTSRPRCKQSWCTRWQYARRRSWPSLSRWSRWVWGLTVVVGRGSREDGGHGLHRAAGAGGWWPGKKRLTQDGRDAGCQPGNMAPGVAQLASLGLSSKQQANKTCYWGSTVCLTGAPRATALLCSSQRQRCGGWRRRRRGVRSWWTASTASSSGLRTLSD